MKNNNDQISLTVFIGTLILVTVIIYCIAKEVDNADSKHTSGSMDIHHFAERGNVHRCPP